MNDVTKGRVRFARPYQSMRAALTWSIVWITLALVFNALLWLYCDLAIDRMTANTKALNFFTGYLIEKSLSLDNLFAFYIIFKQLHIPPSQQQRVFSYGIWGAVVLRLALISMGVWLVTHFHWVLYVMGAFLLFTGIKMFFVEEKEKNIADSMLIKVVKRFFRVTPELHGEHFFVINKGLYYVTPLFVALIFVEFSDLIFAFDSIPAIFAITTDPFIVWSSNIFAILGLRAMYFMLTAAVAQFHLLKYGVALILVFVGVKMVIAPWIGISILLSLGVIAGILLSFIIMSFVRK